MAAYRRVYDSRHLQADCQEPGSFLPRAPSYATGRIHTDEDDGKHVPTGGKHGGRAEHQEIEHLPATPRAEPTQCLVHLHTGRVCSSSQFLFQLFQTFIFTYEYHPTTIRCDITHV